MAGVVVGIAAHLCCGVLGLLPLLLVEEQEGLSQEYVLFYVYVLLTFAQSRLGRRQVVGLGYLSLILVFLVDKLCPDVLS